VRHLADLVKAIKILRKAISVEIFFLQKKKCVLCLFPLPSLTSHRALCENDTNIWHTHTHTRETLAYDAIKCTRRPLGAFLGSFVVGLINFQAQSLLSEKLSVAGKFSEFSQC
jgi:hypothetical protein